MLLSGTLQSQCHKGQKDTNKLLWFQNQCGSRVLLQDIKEPESYVWGTTFDAVEAAFQLEKGVNQAFLELQCLESDQRDRHLCHILETHYLSE